MGMRDYLIADLFRFLAKKGQFEVGHPSKDVERQRESLPVPLDVKRLLQWQWPRSYVEVGPYGLNPAEDILRNEDLSRLLPAHMIPIGNARNGDLLVVRFATEGQAEVGLVSHDELWEGECEPEQAYVAVSATVEEYLYRAAEGRYLPIDSCAATDLVSLQSEMDAKSGLSS
jgi:hypothetical protein